ncbi:hypothetical protein BDK51DRAFT_38774 [Blyttiomyces helicus]|uniref:Pentacotripeptide-repeat region of PRORP domain-containing protein n=1 Tax=Blyttiomyces helicus TaxID=388810 RepID=A0A4P9W9M2_9FUNG|nr:hypothetical protein BDK51DRAFT_38774 [Blyttiomyces helicus]|eukprot:RKO87828.1 hypothetical protein BDK51DRAFT_38774 [Blyttiomyces helicus]
MGLLRLIPRCTRQSSLCSLRPPSLTATRNYGAPVPPRFGRPRMPITSSTASPFPLSRSQTATPRPKASDRPPRPPFPGGNPLPYARSENARRELRDALGLNPPDRVRALRAWKSVVAMNGLELLTDEVGAAGEPADAAGGGRSVCESRVGDGSTGVGEGGDVRPARYRARKLRRIGTDGQGELGYARRPARFRRVDKMRKRRSDEDRLSLIDDTFIDALFLAAARSDARALFEARIFFHAVVSGDVPAARRLLDQAREMNFNLGVAAYNHILDALITTGRHDEIAGHFDEMRKRGIEADGITYHLLLTMYDPYSKHGHANPVAAVKTFEAMRAKDIAPRPFHYVALARAVKRVVAASASRGLQALLFDNAIKPNAELLNGIRDGFAALREYDLALKVSDGYLTLSRHYRHKLPIRSSWAQRHLEMLVLAGRGSVWRTAVDQISFHDTPIDTEMCDAIMAQYKGYRTVEAASTTREPLDRRRPAEGLTTAREPFNRMRSVEAAATARDLFDRMCSVGARFSAGTIESMLVTAWDPEKDATLNSDALRYVKAYVKILPGPTAIRIEHSGLMAKALKVVGGGTIAKGLSTLRARLGVTSPGADRLWVAKAKGSEPSAVSTPVPQRPNPEFLQVSEPPSPPLDAIRALIADGRAAEWETALADLQQRGEAPTPGTYLALLAHYAPHPYSPETAATARAILAHQINASKQDLLLIPEPVAFAHVLATLWKNEPNEALSDEAIDVLALFARTDKDGTILKVSRRPVPKPLLWALRMVGDGDAGRALSILRSGTKDETIPEMTAALDAINGLIATGRVDAWESTVANLLDQGHSMTAEAYRALLAVYAAQPCSPETAAAARAILAHQIAASAANPSLIPDAEAVAHVLATLWKNEPGEALSDEALDVLALFARTHEYPPEILPAQRTPAADPLFAALSIVSGESRSPKEGLEIMRSGAKDVKRRLTPDELKMFVLGAERKFLNELTPALDAVNALIAGDRVKDWEVTAVGLALQGYPMTVGAYHALLAYYAAKPCSPESAATARAILAHQIDASEKKIRLKPDATSFAHVVATIWKGRPDEALSDEALDILTLFAKSHKDLSEFHYRKRGPAAGLLLEALRVVAGSSKLAEIGLMRMRLGARDVKRKWAPSDSEYSARVAETTGPRPRPRPLTLEPTPALDAVSELVASGGVDNWEATVADLERQGHSMTPEAYLTLLAALAARPCSPQIAATARAILAHHLAAGTTTPDLIPGARAFSHVLGTMWKNKRFEELSDDALDLLALFARTHSGRNRMYLPIDTDRLRVALRIVSGESRDVREGMRVMREGRKEGMKRKWREEDLEYYAQQAKERVNRRKEGLDVIPATSAAEDGELRRASGGGSNPAMLVGEC